MIVINKRTILIHKEMPLSLTDLNCTKILKGVTKKAKNGELNSTCNLVDCMDKKNEESKGKMKLSLNIGLSFWCRLVVIQDVNATLHQIADPNIL